MAWIYKRAITIDETKCGTADSTNFPMLFAGTYTYLKTEDNGGLVKSASGYDIAFFSDEALTTMLDFERVSWVGTTGVVQFYIKIPTLSTSANTVIYLAYGNADISTDQQDAVNTWNANFIGVYHLQADSQDSTTNNLDGTDVNTPTYTDGKILKAGTYASASAQYSALQNDAKWRPAAMSFIAWVKGTNWDAVRPIWTSVNGNDYMNFSVRNGGKLGCYYANDAEALVGHYTEGSVLDIGTWYRLACVMNTSGVISYISGGQNVASTTGAGTINHPSVIPQIAGETGNTRYMNGQIDELMVLNTTVTTSWITADYNNQSSPSTFYTIGDAATVYTQNLTDTLTLTDTLFKIPIKLLSQTLTLTDTISKTSIRILSDTLTITASLLKIPARILSDILTFSDLSGLIENIAATSPQTMADDAIVGTVAWTNPDNAKVSDNVYASVTSAGANSHYLKATNFGFSIPSGATINGILVEIEKHRTVDGFDRNVKIVKADGTIGTTNKADTGTNWGATDAYYPYGSSSDLWDETWDDTKINDVDFGVVFSAYTSSSILVDHIRITVYYTGGVRGIIIGLVRTLTDTLSFIDNLIRSLFLTEILTLTDTVSKTSSRIFTETITLTDSVLKTATKMLTEIIIFTDSIIKAIGRTFTEIITLTDTFILVRFIEKILTETLNFLDISLAFVLNKVSSGIKKIVISLFKGEFFGGSGSVSKQEGMIGTVSKPSGGILDTVSKPTGIINHLDKPEGV